MKKLLLLSLGCTLTSSATAQTEKGTRYIGANVGNLGYSRDDETSVFSASLTPAAGVFVTNNLLLGADLPVNYYRRRFNPNYQNAFRTSYRSLGVGLAPFARYYVPGAELHRFFGQLSGGASWVSTRDSGNPLLSIDMQRSNDSFSFAEAALGYNYFLTPGAALEVIAGYDRSFGSNTRNGSGAFNLRAGFAVFLPFKGMATPAN